MIHKGLRSEVNQLKIRCSNNGRGCKWTGELGALKAHLESESGCGFVMVECPNKCIIFNSTCTLLRIKIKNHLAQRCYLRSYVCEFCGLKDTYEAITGIDNYLLRPNNYSGHQATCPELPLTCPNECGSEFMFIKRKDMDGHRSKCPMEPVECPFAEAGCKGAVLRCRFQDHMTSSQQKHLLMLMMDNQMTKKALKETRDELMGVTVKLGEAEDKLVETESSLLHTQAKLIDTEDKLSETEAKLIKSKDKLSETEAKVNVVVERLSLLEECISLGSKLQNKGDRVEVVMPKFSEYRRSGKVWHSPPFYYREGYKMCLAVYANGVGKGVGTHISASLLLLRGKYDNQLKWPTKCYEDEYHTIQMPGMGSATFVVCSEKHLVVNEQNKIDEVNHLCRLDSDALHLVNDCLTLYVEFLGKCYLKVHV